MEFGNLFIKPNILCIDQNDIDSLRAANSGSLSQSQLKDLQSLIFRLHSSLIDSFQHYRDQFQHLTESDKFKKSLEMAFRAQSQIPPIQQRFQSEEVPKPMVKVPQPIMQGPPLVPVNKQDPAWTPRTSSKTKGSTNHKRPRPKMNEVKQDKPKRQNSSKSDKHKDFKKIDLSGDKQIWSYVDQLFGQLPSNEDLERLLSVPKYDAVDMPQQEHWSQRMIPIVQAQKESRKNSNILMPPLPPPSSQDVSEFWADKMPTFQMEDQQMLNTSTIHRLLSAFVATEPMPKSDAPKTQYLKSNPLPPHVSFDSYLSLPFDERLKWELESIDLSPDGIQKNMDGGPFAQEIEEYQKSLNEIAPKLEDYKKKLFKRISEFREKEKKRIKYNRNFAEIVEKYNDGEFRTP